MFFEEGFGESPGGVELFLAGDAGAGAKVAVEGSCGEDDPGGTVDFAGGGVAAGVDKGGEFVALAEDGVHAHHGAATPGAVKADVALTFFKVAGHLDKVEGAAIVVPLDGVGDLFEGGGGAIVFAGDLDAEFFVTKDGIVVDGEAAVGGIEVTAGGLDEGVDLGGAGFVGAGKVVELDEQCSQASLEPAADACLAHEVAGLVVLEAKVYVDVGAGDPVRVGGGDLFDAGAAYAGEHDEGGLGPIVDDDAGVKFAGDVELFFDEDLFDGKAFDFHAEHSAGRAGGLVGGGCFFDAADAGTSGDPGLGLDHDGPGDLGGKVSRLVGGGGDAALRYGDVELLEERFSLIFVESGHNVLPPFI